MNYTQSKFNSKETEQNPNNFKLEFSKVSENMNELVEHLNTIQNDLANQLKNQENTNSWKLEMDEHIMKWQPSQSSEQKREFCGTFAGVLKDFIY